MTLERKKKAGRPRKETNWTAEILRARANEYFLACDRRTEPRLLKTGEVAFAPSPRPYTVEGLCADLEIPCETFATWRVGGGRLGETAELIFQRIVANRVEGALSGKQNGSVATFLLKNMNPKNYRDRVELEANLSDDAKDLIEGWMDAWKKPTFGNSEER